jgi:hypothetical protein
MMPDLPDTRVEKGWRGEAALYPELGEGSRTM